MNSTMKLQRIHISAFKALTELDVDVGGRAVTIAVGPNGAGKTSLLQALGFIRYFAEGRTGRFFEDHSWEPDAVISHLLPQRKIGFYLDVGFIAQNGARYSWMLAWSAYHKHTISERIVVDDDFEIRTIFTLKKGYLSFDRWDNAISGINPEGSCLSVVDISKHPNEEDRAILQSLRAWASGIISLELLSPAAMRRMARGRPADIGVRGELLGSFLASLSSEKKERITKRLSLFYPHLSALSTRAKRAGWIDFKIGEVYGGRKLSVGAAHVSDGFLRLLALASIPEFPKSTSLVLLDEAENGIDPLILPDFIDQIVRESDVQLVLTSHSPLLVNRFSPEAVLLLCRSEEGPTIGVSMAHIPEIQAELEYRNPGEIWAHGSLEQITGWVRDAHRRLTDI